METLDVERNFFNFVHFCSNKQSLIEKEDNCSIIRKFHYCLSIKSVTGVSTVFFEHLVTILQPFSNQKFEHCPKSDWKWQRDINER